MERNGPGGMKTESLSPMIKSGVATPKLARTNIMTVIAIAATRPASNPAEKALVLLIACRSYKLGAKENRLFSLCGRWVCEPRFQIRQFATSLCAARVSEKIYGNFENAKLGARLSSAFRDSIRRFAPACRAFQARLVGLPET